MKTFAEIHKSMFNEIFKSPSGWPEGLTQTKVFEQAAKEYAKQWIDKAADVAEVMGIEAFDYMQYVVDKESIIKLKKEIDAQ